MLLITEVSMSEFDNNLRPAAWREAQDGWLVLMDAAHKFKRPREIVSDTDEYILKSAVKAQYPNDELKSISDGNKRFLVRRPRA